VPGSLKLISGAAGTLVTRLPEPPKLLDPARSLNAAVTTVDDKAYQRIAADLRGAITCGALKPGELLQPFNFLADRYSVASNTVQRAVKLLAEEGLVVVSRGRRAVVVPQELTG
jgi:DNA-binding FadR family transcriptional regulator